MCQLKIANIRTIISENDLYSQFKSDFDDVCIALETVTAPDGPKPDDGEEHDDDDDDSDDDDDDNDDNDSDNDDGDSD